MFCRFELLDRRHAYEKIIEKSLISNKRAMRPWISHLFESWPQSYKKCSCSTKLSTNFQLLIKTKIPTNEEVYCFKSLRCCFIIMLVKVKMSTVVGILTFMSRKILCSVELSIKKSFITPGPAPWFRKRYLYNKKNIIGGFMDKMIARVVTF